MPFGYFGAKHALARFYPPPTHDTIVEPFAGAAGYSCYWAKDRRVILLDINPNVVALWHRLQAMSEADLFAISDPIKGERTTEPLIAAASGEQGMSVLEGKSRQITDRMVSAWPRLRDRVAAALPKIKGWEIKCAHATEAPDIEATWFVDPPYQPRLLPGYNTGGARFVNNEIKSYGALGRWCMKRRGQLIVCEQEPAAWLPFEIFRRQRNGVGAGTGATRTEQVFIRA